MWRTSDAGRIGALVVFRAMGDGFVPVGSLAFEGGGRRRSSRFVYARSYLERGDARPIDPVGLPLRRGSVSSTPDEVPLVFFDAGPDGWAKGILDQAYPTLSFGMAEYLALGTSTRTGDLAFGPTPEGPLTWNPGSEPLLHLPRDDDDLEALVRAAAAVDAGEAEAHHLRLLLRHSRDVGGARPKVRLRHAGRDVIAKFQAWGDKFDDPRVECACLDVAEASGIDVSPREVVRIGSRSVLLVQRFDRSVDGRPHGYLSFATLLRQPPTRYATERTYADLVAAGRGIGVADPSREVFRRLLVNAYLRNTDDHLRNHAVIDEGDGWRLAPAFDIVPQPGGLRHVCAPAPGVSPE